MTLIKTSLSVDHAHRAESRTELARDIARSAVRLYRTYLSSLEGSMHSSQRQLGLQTRPEGKGGGGGGGEGKQRSQQEQKTGAQKLRRPDERQRPFLPPPL